MEWVKDAVEVNVMDEMMDGTFDNRVTNCREVWVNGTLAINIKSYVMPHVRLGNGKPANLLPFGTFPDNPNNQ